MDYIRIYYSKNNYLNRIIIHMNSYVMRILNIPIGRNVKKIGQVSIFYNYGRQKTINTKTYEDFKDTKVNREELSSFDKVNDVLKQQNESDNNYKSTSNRNYFKLVKDIN